jgi:hypothetical protein
MTKTIATPLDPDPNAEKRLLSERGRRRLKKLSALIGDAIRKLKRDPIYGELIERFDALPIADDASGCLLLREDGELFTMGWNTSGQQPRQATDVRPFLKAVIDLAQRYPEISRLLLERPPSAVECPDCRGTGSDRHDLGCGTCCRLGWITNYALTLSWSGRAGDGPARVSTASARRSTRR